MKKLIVLCLLLLLAGCGVPAGEAGADGSSGASGNDGRDYETPIIRPYTWDTSFTVANFQDVTASYPQLSQVAMNLVNDNNYLLIRVPANNAGKEIQVVINGTRSVKFIVPDNNSGNLVFSTKSGIDYTWGKYMNCSSLDMNNRYSYFAVYVDGYMQEYYFCDSFEL